MKNADDARVATWPSRLFDAGLPRRIVALSPHLDDAVMSLGGTILRLVGAGVKVEVVTVFACDPTSAAEAEPWDSRSGFSTEGHAARVRRDEDEKACRVLGAEPRWLSFGAGSYERRGTRNEIWAALEAVTRGADCVLLPGYPLVHHDHAELTLLTLRRGLHGRRIGLYSEQPYSFYQRKTASPLSTVPALKSVIQGSLTWTRLGATGQELSTKKRAVRAYRSQLKQLGLGIIGRNQMLRREASQGGEAIAWVNRPSA